MRTNLRLLSIARVTLTVTLLLSWGACAHRGEATATPAVSAQSIDGEWVLVGRTPIVSAKLTVAQGNARLVASEGRESETEDYRIVGTAGRRTDFARVRNGQVEPKDITPFVVLSAGHALWLSHGPLAAARAYRFTPIPDTFFGTHPMDPNPDQCSTVAVSDRSILLTFGNGKTEEFLARTVTNQDATTVRVATNLGTLVLTREGERLRLEVEPSLVNSRIQYTGHFQETPRRREPRPRCGRRWFRMGDTRSLACVTCRICVVSSTSGGTRGHGSYPMRSRRMSPSNS